MSSLRHHFPFFEQSANHDLVYLDSAATSLKPQSVIDAVTRYLVADSVNVHRAGYRKANELTDRYEQVRVEVSKFIGAQRQQEVVFTSGTTASINMLSSCLTEFVLPGQDIFVSELEHHANLVPWQQLAKRTRANLNVIPVRKGALDWEWLEQNMTDNAAVVCVAHVSNLLGHVHPVEQVCQLARRHNAISVVDGAQAVAHIPVNVSEIGCDFYAFSGHKCFAPTGVGILWGQYAWLERLPVWQTGGEMVSQVTCLDASFQKPPLKFEAGTPNIAAVLGLGEAISWIRQSITDDIHHQLAQLQTYLHQQLQDIDDIQVLSRTENTIPLVAFRHREIHHQDLALALDAKNIALRSGHHCAMPAVKALGIEGCLRVSLSVYNSVQDVDRFLISLRQILAHSYSLESIPSVSTEADFIQRIRAAKGWDAKYREVLIAGKRVARFPTQMCTDERLIRGCESPVWLLCEERANEWHFAADSPSKVVRGLLACLLHPIEGRSREVVRAFDARAWLEELGLLHFLSDSRQNGLRAVIDAICDQVAQA